MSVEIKSIDRKHSNPNFVPFVYSGFCLLGDEEKLILRCSMVKVSCTFACHLLVHSHFSWSRVALGRLTAELRRGDGASRQGDFGGRGSG